MGIFNTLRSIVDKAEDALENAEQMKDELLEEAKLAKAEYTKRFDKAVKAFGEDEDEEIADGADHRDSDSK